MNCVAFIIHFACVPSVWMGMILLVAYSLSPSQSPKALISLHLPNLHLPFCFAVIHCSVLHIPWFPSPISLYLCLSFFPSFTCFFLTERGTEYVFESWGKRTPGTLMHFSFFRKKFLKRDSEKQSTKRGEGENDAKCEIKQKSSSRPIALIECSLSVLAISFA